MQETVKKLTPEPDYKIIGTRPPRPDGVDKVTGRARFGADFSLPGQLTGRVLRSPHPHAIIKSIDVSAAAALPGVKAVVTRDDFKDQASEFVPAGEMLINYRDVVRNVMARERALYEGHAVAAVAATSPSIAKAALKLIKVDYEILPHVLDVDEAMAPGAPILHPRHDHRRHVEPAPKTESNVAKRVEFIRRRRLEGLQAGADVIVERSFDHQAGASGLHRAARLPRDSRRGRPGRRLGVDPGPLGRARPLRPPARHGHLEVARDRDRNRRRVRRQDRGLSRAGRAWRCLANPASR